MKKRTFILLIFILPVVSFAQENTNVDSLKNLLSAAENDSIKTDLSNSIAYYYFRSFPDSTMIYAEKAINLGKKINYTYGKGRAYRMIGLAYSAKSEYDKALSNYFLSLKEFKSGNFALEVGKVLTSIGIIYRKKNDIETALTYYLKSLDIIKLENDSAKIAAAYTNVGVIYKVLKDYDKALEYHNKSLNICRRTGSKKGVPYALGNIALIYKEQNEYEKAEEYLMQALKLFEEYDFKNESASSYSALGEIYSKQGKYQEAFNFLQKAISIYNQTGNISGKAETYIILGSLYFEQGMYQVAEKALIIGLSVSEENDYKTNVIKAYLYISKLDSTRRNYKEAYNNYKKYSELKDSIYSKEKNRAIAEIQTKYDIAEKERENLILKKDKEINDIEIKRQKLLKYLIGLVLILMFVVVFVTVYHYIRIKKVNTLLKSKNAEIKSQNISLHNFQEEIQSQYQEIATKNESLEIYKNELEDKVKLRTKELNAALIKAKESDNLKSKFLENLSHEIRTPMNAIAGFSEIMTKENFNAKPAYLYGINKSMDDLVSTVDKLVTFSTLQLDQYEIKHNKINLRKYFNKVMSKTQEKKVFLKKDNIKLEQLIDFEALPEIFVCDEFVLDCIIKELLDNAMKFTEKGTISVTACLIKGSLLCVKVKDTGVGIKKEMISQVYEFMRKLEHKDVLYRGMGVGLTLVQRAAQIISADIKIDSIDKEGAEITITIPEITKTS